jgi:hypothetical protein
MGKLSVRSEIGFQNNLAKRAANSLSLLIRNALLFDPSGVKSLPAGTIMQAVFIQGSIICTVDIPLSRKYLDLKLDGTKAGIR